MKKKQCNPTCLCRWKKLFLMMRITTILILAGLIHVSASVYSQRTNLELKLKDVSVEEVLRKIEEQSNFYFLYRSDFLKDLPKVSINVTRAGVEEILNQIVVPYGFGYEIDDKIVVIRKSPEAPVLNQQGQKLPVKGKVTDSSGFPLPGVSVVIKGTTTGTITNIDGEYSLLNVSSDGTLVFSFVGMKTKEIPVSGKTMIDVVMQEETIGIDEVVAIGYGTMKKSDLTGSVASVTNEKFENRPATNVLQSIQGNAAGVTITQSSSLPGASPSIYIRGLNSISASNTPLVVIDGVPGSLDLVNPNDIASIDILKDASSSAIYGARGANGVVLITTKRGAGKPKVSYNTYYGIKKATELIDLMDADTYLYYRQKFAEYTEGQGSEVVDVLKDEEYLNYTQGITTDWQDLVFNNALVSEHNLSVSGGENSLNYFLSANYLDHDHIAGNYNLERKSIRLNIDKEFNDWLKIGNNLQVVDNKTSGSTGGLWNVYQLSPYTSPTDPDGNLYIWPLESSTDYLVNPLTYQNADLNSKNVEIRENIFAEIMPVKGLKYKINYGYTIISGKSNSYYGEDTADGYNYDGYAEKSSSNSTRWLLENIVDYEKAIENHSFHFTGLYSAEEYEYEYLYANAYGFVNDILKYNSLSAASNYDPPSSSASRWAMTSLMARLNYNYNEKYMLTLTYRRDGYSAFGENKKYGNFPSAAIAWRLSQEDFLKNSEIVSQLKLRLSWGKNGNQAVNPYSSQAKIGQSVPYAFGSSTDGVYGFYPSTIANSGLGWETTTSSDIGIDFGIFKNRLSGSVEYYHTKTSDLLLTRAIPYTTGFSSIYDNIGKTQNDGVEVSLNTINISGSNGFKWSSNLNFSYNKNQIVDLYGDKQDDIGNGWFIGKPINVYYDYVFDGIWQEDDDIANSHMPSAEPGTVRLKDISGPDGVPDEEISADYDRQIIGKKNPDFLWGFTNNFQYKNFDLSIFIQGVHGVTGYHDLHYQNVRSSYMAMLDVDYWLPESPGNKYATGIYDRSNTYSDLPGYRDASYIRLKDITLGYTLPQDIVKKAGIDKLRFYLNATNLFTVTDWPLYDPETTSATMPMAKSYIIGLNVSF